MPIPPNESRARRTAVGGWLRHFPRLTIGSAGVRRCLNIPAIPPCIFRLDISRAPRELRLRDGTLVRPGDRVARLHFWNEQIPTLPEDGATIAWARRMQRAISVSLQELAHYLAGRPDLADVAVICGYVPSGTKSQSRTGRPHHGLLRLRDDSRD